MSNEQTIRDAIISYCPDAEIINVVSHPIYDEILGYNPKIDGDQESNPSLEVWHWVVRHENWFYQHEAVESILMEISKLKHVQGIKKLYIRQVSITSEAVRGTDARANNAMARFTLGF